MRAFLSCFVACCVALVLSSCTTTSSPVARLVVANESAGAISDVTVAFSETDRRLVVPALSPRSVGEAAIIEDGIPAALYLEWRTADGAVVRKTVERAEALPANFKGLVLLQIEDDGVVRPFVQHAAGEEEADIPWARPESWEGSPAIPGLTDR